MTVTQKTAAVCQDGQQLFGLYIPAAICSRRCALYVEPILSLLPFVKMTCVHGFQVGIGVLDAEVPPGEEAVERMIVFLLGNQMLQPDLFNPAERIYGEELVDVRKVEIDKDFLYQQIVRDLLYGCFVEGPETMFVLQLH